MLSPADEFVEQIADRVVSKIEAAAEAKPVKPELTVEMIRDAVKELRAAPSNHSAAVSSTFVEAAIQNIKSNVSQEKKRRLTTFGIIEV